MNKKKNIMTGIIASLLKDVLQFDRIARKWAQKRFKNIYIIAMFAILFHFYLSLTFTYIK